MNRQKKRKVNSRVDTVLEKKGFHKSELFFFLSKKPNIPFFPKNVFGLAVLKDILDLLDLTLLGIILTTLFSILFTIFLFFWTMRRGVGFVKKRIIKMIAKFIALLIFDFIPFVKIVPFTAVYVLLVHNSHTKIVKAMIESVSFVENILKKENLSLEEFLQLQEREVFKITTVKRGVE